MIVYREIDLAVAREMADSLQKLPNGTEQSSAKSS